MPCTDPLFAPRVLEQLNTRTPATTAGGNTDCGPASIFEMLHWVSCGLWKFGDKARRVEQIDRIRALGGSVAIGGTFASDNRRAFDLIVQQDFPALGLSAVSSTLMLGASFDNTFLPKLVAGRVAYVQLDYQVIGQTQYKGQCVDYRLNHAHCVGDYRLIGGVPYVTSLDPLTDGRASSSCGGSTVAKGPQVIPVSLLRQAMTTLYTGGGITAITSPFATVLSAPPPPPDDTTPPPDTGFDPDPQDPCGQDVGG